MKKSMLATIFVAFPLLAKTTQLKTYGCIAIICLAGCTATQVRWDATNMRKQVMVYYNDQIMDNLIRAKNHLPFVHVDITLLTSQGASQISGTVGGGETQTHTDSPPNMMGALASVTKAVTRSFMFSVSPQQTETLSIQAAPALGSQAIASMSLPMIPTKETDEYGRPEENKPTKITKEKAPTPVTIYQLYEKFAKSPHLSVSPIRPQEGAYLRGTLKRSDAQDYYYIANNDTDKLAYYELCKKLFTKGQAGSLEKKLEQVQAAAALPTR